MRSSLQEQAWDEKGGSRSWDDAWRAEYKALNAARDETEERLNSYLRGEPPPVARST
jgi:hypothetical protein